MEINAKNMAVLFTAVNTKFRDAFKKYEDNTWMQFAGLIPMTTGIVEMPVIEQITKLREWVGPRQINKLSAQKLTVKPRKFEQTYEVPCDTIEDDTYGMTSGLLEQMGQSAANLPNDLIEEILNNASSHNWLDGAAFFGTTRKYGKNTIANYTTSALSSDSLKAAYNAMTAYKGHEGAPLKVRPSVLVHGPALHFKAKELLENENILHEGTNGETSIPNPTRGLVKDVELAGLDGNKWFLVAADGVIKPIYYFERKRPSSIARLDHETDSVVFVEDKVLYGVKGRAESAFVLPHLIYFGNAS